jgi:AcrR family transcriptional regulator
LEKTNSSNSDTSEKIMDAAETLFIEKGFAATSLRAIANSANVNLAAANYHFGCKEDLFAAVIHRRVTPINHHRIELLDRLEASDKSLSTKEIVEAFLQPLTSSGLPAHLPAFISRISSEPQAAIRDIIQEEFAEVAMRFQTALVRANPLIDAEDINWRFHFLVGGMLQLVGLLNPPGIKKAEISRKERFEKLVTFAVAGLEAA